MYDVSTEYGRAIFELALEENKDRLYLEQLREINKLLEENPEFIHLLYSLNIPLLPLLMGRSPHLSKNCRYTAERLSSLIALLSQSLLAE